MRPQTVAVSATPSGWELDQSGGVFAEQVIRPTGLIDPPVENRWAKTQVDDVLGEIKIMFFRCWLLIIRDPILYLGRMAAFLFGNIFFGFVYWNARPFVQERALDKMWINVWYCAVSTNSKCLSMSVYLYLLPFCDGLR